MQIEHSIGTPAGGGPYDAASAKIQIFCLPHAGGSTAHFRGWHWLAPHAQIVPVDLPGHGTRLLEPLISEWPVLLEDLTKTIVEQIQAPYVIFGHSLGSLLAFEICRTLQSRGCPPVLLVTAGRNGPSENASQPSLHELPDAQFIAALRRLGGFPDSLLQQAELLQMFLPMLRADLRLAEMYTRRPGPLLDSPIIAFAGRHDRMTDDVGMLAWRRETTKGCELIRIDGGHFFLDHAEFIDAFILRIARLIEPGPRASASA